jgi:Hexokinase
MEDSIFQLNTTQLTDIAHALEKKIQEGLEKPNQEVLCIPTYINPNTNLGNEKALVLDLGGTNFRVAIVEFADGEAIIHPKSGIKAKFDELMKRPAERACERDELYKAIADIVGMLDLTGIKHIGYCFSYPCENTHDGDAILLKWTKGVTVKGMVVNDPANAQKDNYVGYSLMEYLNKHIKGADFISIKVINDTVAALFSGLTDTEAQAHIGLIVGTGTNMATFFPENKIGKLHSNKSGLIPVNLESGNFRPPHLSVIDNKIDKYSDSRGAQRFEKAISGMYLGRILEYLFSSDEFEENFDAQELTKIMSYPDRYKERYVHAAHLVYERSAKLVAASLAGLILEQVATYTEPINKVRLAAEGGLFWSEDSKSCDSSCRFTPYKEVAMNELDVLLDELGYGEIRVYAEQMDNANLIGSAIAALS